MKRKRILIISFLALLTLAAIAPAQVPTNQVSPSNFNFLGVVGEANPSTQTQTLTLLSSTPNWTATTDGSPWLIISQNAGSGSGSFQVAVDGTNLQPGRYTGSFTIQVTGTQDSFTQSVIFNYAASRLKFNGSQGGSNPASQTVQLSVASSGTFTATWSTSVSTTSGGNWLSATASGQGPTASISVNTAGLSQGSYTGQVNFTNVTAPNPPVVPVTLTVGPPQPSFNPAQVTFTATAGGADPATQSVALSIPANFSPTAWTSSVTTASGVNWLTATPSSGTGGTTLTVGATGLSKFAGGVYTGNVTLTFGTQTFSLPVVLTAGLAFTAQPGGATPASQTIAVTASNTWLASASTATGGNWLSITNVNGSGNGTINVTANPSGLALGTYTGAVTVTIGSGTSATQQVIPITFTIAVPALTVSPLTLTFNGNFAGTTPATQTVNVTAASAWTGSVSTTSGGNWLQISPASGNGNGQITVTANLGNLAGTYQGQIAISLATGQPMIVNVTLNVAGPGLSVNPTAVNVSVAAGTNPAAVQLFLNSTSTTPGTSWQGTVSTTSGGGWLSLGPSAGAIPSPVLVTINSASLAPGTYQGQITISDPTSLPTSVTVPVTLTVTTPAVAVINVTPTVLNLQGTVGSPFPSQTIAIGANSVNALSWTAALNVDNGGAWLGMTSTSGTASLSQTSQPTVIINTAGLKSGVYTGQVTVSSGNGQPQMVNIQLTMSVAGPALVLGQSAVQLLTSGQTTGLIADSVTVPIANSGTGTLNWTASIFSPQGSPVGFVANPNGIAVNSTAGGTSIAGNPSSLTIGVPANGVGNNFSALVQVTATGAQNSPQFITVTGRSLNTTNLTALYNALLTSDLRIVSPVGVVFVAGGQSTATLNVNTAGLPNLTLSTAVSTSGGSGNWLAATLVTGSGNSQSVTLNLVNAFLPTAPGIYRGVVTVTLTAPLPSGASKSYDVFVALVVPGTTGVGAEAKSSPAGICTPKTLGLIARTVGSNFNSTVGYPVNIETQVFDDCGNPATSATVLASFPSDPPLALINLGNGIYSATWKPSTANATQVTLRAIQAPLTPGLLVFNGNVASNPTPQPAVSAGGVVNAASFSKTGGLAPGAIVSVFGSNLANGTNGSSFPLPTTLGGIKLTIGGVDMPLFFSNNGQVNAQVPFTIPVATQSQVLARAINGSGTETDAIPESVTISAAQPGIFVTGSAMQGVILNNPALQVVDATHQATAGDVLTIYCTGLGATTPAVGTGLASPSPAATVSGTTVTIGGIDAPVQFSGLTPGLVGLYQVNVTVPKGITAGPLVQVVMTQGGVNSNTVTIGVK